MDKYPNKSGDSAMDRSLAGSRNLHGLNYYWHLVPAPANLWTAKVYCGLAFCEIVPAVIESCPSQAAAATAAQRAIEQHHQTVHKWLVDEYEKRLPPPDTGPPC